MPQKKPTARPTDVVLRIVGESGEGTVTLGDVLVELFTGLGLDIYTFQTFPAEIKGGTVMYQLRTKSGVTLSPGDVSDVLVALNNQGFGLFGDNLRSGGILLYNSDAFSPPVDPTRTDYALPITTLARAEKDKVRHEVSGEQLKRLPAPVNTVGLGALLRLVNAPLEPAEEYLGRVFARKGEAIVRMNISALHTGATCVAEQIGDRETPHVGSRPDHRDRIMVTGNQMLCMGAIAAGLKFFGGYPITPASEIMEFLAKELPAFGGNVIQAEDEIAALGMCLGASFGGVPSMTATSGPGLSLMVEQINLAGQAEIPVVIVDVQRGGASTGLPTKTSQGDLNLAVYGVHNESPRIVLAASSVGDVFWTTVEAINLAETYQCPVILLSEQALATRRSTVPPPMIERVTVKERLKPAEADLGPEFKRYLDTSSGVSPMAIPGTPGGMYTTTGIEHNEFGDPTYTPDTATKARNKRFRKMDTLLVERGHEFVRTWGDAGKVELGVIAFGATEGVVREATERLRYAGHLVAHLHLRLIRPLPVAPINEFAVRCKRLLVVELNYSGQLAGWLRVNTDMTFETFHRDDGRPFSSHDIEDEMLRILSD
jgi:2-oxoglutarate ferredoxin oxidoreductase subunit alpha